MYCHYCQKERLFCQWMKGGSSSVADALRFMNDCYIEKVVDDCHTEQL